MQSLGTLVSSWQKRGLMALVLAVALAGLGITPPAHASHTVTTYNWSQGMSSVAMELATDRICVLTRVRGDFEGGGEEVRVFVGSDGRWYLGGKSSQSGVAATARCFLRNSFLGENATGQSQPARMLSPEMFAWRSGSSCGSASADTWWGDAATFVSGMSGDFDGLGEAVQAVQSINGFGPSQVRATVCDGFVRAYAHSFFVGNPSTGDLARFRGPNGVGTAGTIQEYVANRNTVQMAGTHEAVCYFSRIAGKFAGGGEWAEIAPIINGNGQEVWALRTASQQGGLEARARCFLFDQR